MLHQKPSSYLIDIGSLISVLTLIQNNTGPSEEIKYEKIFREYKEAMKNRAIFSFLTYSSSVVWENLVTAFCKMLNVVECALS